MQENHLANPPLCIDALRDAGRFVLDQVDQHIFRRNETYLILIIFRRVRIKLGSIFTERNYDVEITKRKMITLKNNPSR